MRRYATKNSITSGLKKMLSKYGSIPIKTDKLEGCLKVVGYRKYPNYEEIDVEFSGKIKARVTWGKLEWMNSSIMTDKSKKISKIKVNRFIKKASLSEIKRQMNYFGIRIDNYSFIKKIKWI
jgi:hypothetical protein